MRTTNTTTAATTRQLCTFLVDGISFGVDVMNVQEVIRYQEMTPVPLAAATVRGLINLRGQIVTAVDMRARLGLEPAISGLPMNVVATVADGIVSFLVDEIGDVLEVDERAFERVPETLPANLKECVTGVYKLEGRLLLLLDAEKVATLGATVEREDEAA